MSTELITIFTDGSSRGNPGPGGFGAIIIAPKNDELGIGNIEVREIGGREAHTTNNRMELLAAIKALQQIQDSRFKIQVFSDSSYVINGITKWVFGWQKNGWKTIAKKEVENKDLWEKLIEVSKNKDIQWNYVGGHVGVAGNTRCDEIATGFADGANVALYAGPRADYPIKNILDVSHDATLAKEKSTGRAHSNAKAYSYVSLVDGKIETHKTWAECEARVKGKKARFKKVLSADEERKLIQEWSILR
ncbi:MAG: ribonuclease HI [bacterium]|nr:ribonuclease HI [bacterium]